MNSKDKGNLAEAKTLADLLDKGLNVAQPFGDNLPFDLIAIDSNMHLYKVQVKYCAIKNGIITLRKQKWSSNTKRNYVSVYKDQDVDVYALYCVDNNMVYYVPHNVTQTATTSFHLRVIPARGKQLHNANIYEAGLFLNFPTKQWCL